MSSTSNGVRVVTYNVLSSHLCEAEHFPKCNPDYLDPTYRYTKLEDKLFVEIDNGSIICLQEVSAEWAGYLHSFFAEHNYVMISGLYGKRMNGYMGVATAVPLSLYKVQSVSIDTLSDFIPDEFLTPKKPWVRESKPNSAPSFAGVVAAFMNCMKLFMKLICSFCGCSAADEAPKKFDRPEEPPFDLARGRNNQMVTVTLEALMTQKAATPAGRRKSGAQSRKSSMFQVSNYHMPCMFKQPMVMYIHSTLTALVARKLASVRSGGAMVVIPHIIAGDFNMKPVSGMYAAMVTSRHADGGPVPDGVEVTPPRFEAFLTSFYSEHGMHHDGSEENVSVIKSDIRYYSLYREVLGSEPDFTNYATAMSWGGGPPTEFTFIDTLDYIFVSTFGWEELDSTGDPSSDAVMRTEPPASARSKGRKSANEFDVYPSDLNKHLLIPVHHRDEVTRATADDAAAEGLVGVDEGKYGPYPSRDEYSDHIMLGGTLYLN